MALTPLQRGRILARLINKATSGEIDGDQLVRDLLAALGSNFDARLITEAQTFRSELQASKAASDAQSLDLANQIAALNP